MFSLKIFGVKDISKAQDRLKGIRGGLKAAPRVAITRSTDTYMQMLKQEMPVSEREDREHTRDLIEFGGIEVSEDGAEASLKGPNYVQYMIKGTDGGSNIEPLSGLALHFFWFGDEFFASSVTRGATPPNDFLRRTWGRARDNIKKQMKELGLRVARVEPIGE